MPPKALPEVAQRLRAALDYLNEFPNAKIAAVAKNFGVNYSSLRTWKHRRPGVDPLPQGGQKPLFSKAQEISILRYIEDQWRLGFPATPEMVKTFMIRSVARHSPERNSPPSNSTLKRWLKSQDSITLQWSKPIDSKRKAAQGKYNIEHWFTMYKEKVKEYKVTPDRIWNFDETGFRIGCPAGIHIYTPKDVKLVSIISLIDIYIF